MNPIIYYLDDQPSQRKMLEWDLKNLFGAEYAISGLPLHQNKTDYHRFLDEPDVAGVLIDQQLNETGEITGFTGLDLAQHLRGLYKEMPIYLVTGHDPDEQIRGADSGAVEDVVIKSDLRAGTVASSRFRQRFLRHIGRYQEALTVRQNRYRELLTKSLRDHISAEERAELSALEVDRLLPTQAEDEAMMTKLNQQVDAVERLVQSLRATDEKK